MKKTVLFLLLLNVFSLFSQNKKAPVYNTCENVSNIDLEQCFLEHLKADFLKTFKQPKDIDADFSEKILVMFGVSREGTYTVHYANTSHPSIKREINRVFALLPTPKPATYNSNPIESEYILPFNLPLTSHFTDNTKQKPLEKKASITDAININRDLKQFPEINTSLAIPFTHQQYSLIDKYGHQLDNEHSSVKPYFYNETAAFKHVASDKTALFKKTNTYLGKKTWNEQFIYLKGKDYWFTINPIFDWQAGKDNSDKPYTYNNTRAINVRGALGKLSFSSSIYESQGRFAQYINDYNRYLKPANSHAIYVGVGNAKEFKDGGFDYPLAEGYISYAANKHINLQFGTGKNFIGDGYRSLFLSDATSGYTFAKISTTFWKIRYTNLWIWGNDPRTEAFTNDVYLRKYIAAHHLSINLTKRWNLGLFESTITNARSSNVMDVNFVNPIIFYRNVEFARASKSGNAVVGLNSKFKFKKANIYGQFLLDELVVGQVLKNQGSILNKYGMQLGFHYYDLFNIQNLNIQGEINRVRPYTYSHNNPELNYSHYYQSLAHPWGSNFTELIGIVRYNKGRWFGNFKGIYGQKGFDFPSNDINYGGDIFKSYQTGIAENNTYAQGNKATIIIADLQLGYIINPTTNLHIFGSASVRNFKIEEKLPYFEKENTTWFSVGLKSDIFNSYFDF